MPIDALPIPWDEQHRNSPARSHFTRVYQDALGRPLRGTLTLTPTRQVTSHTTIVPANVPVPVELASGVLSVHLPPNVYELRGELRTAEDIAVVVQETVTVTPPPRSR